MIGNAAPRAIALLLALAGTMSSAQPLQVYYFPRPPLYSTKADGSAGGFINEIARLVLDEAKIPYKFVEMPSGRVEPSLRRGDYAAGLGWFKNPGREAWATFSAPIYQDLPLVAVINTSQARAKGIGSTATIDALLGSGLILGIIQGFSYGAFADAAIARIKPPMEAIAGEQTALVLMVAHGHADFLLLGMEEAAYLMEHDEGSSASLKIVRISDAPAGNFRYFMFSKAVDPKTIERVDLAIEKVKAGIAYARSTDFSRYR